MVPLSFRCLFWVLLLYRRCPFKEGAHLWKLTLYEGASFCVVPFNGWCSFRGGAPVREAPILLGLLKNQIPRLQYLQNVANIELFIYGNSWELPLYEGALL